MKKLLFSLLAFLALTAQADGGMWFLKLMEQQHLADSLKKAGLKMPLDQLYNENGPSLRDAIGQFGRGCTGEVISPDGLVLTNNHCGYSYVHGISTTQRNYLRDGYYAKSRAEELPVKDLTFTFIIAIEDVTEAVEAAAKAAGIDTYTMQSQGFLKPFGEKLFKTSKYSTMPGARETGAAFSMEEPSLKVIADHIRSCSFLIADGFQRRPRLRIAPHYPPRRTPRLQTGSKQTILPQTGGRFGQRDGRCLL